MPSKIFHENEDIIMGNNILDNTMETVAPKKTKKEKGKTEEKKRKKEKLLKVEKADESDSPIPKKKKKKKADMDLSEPVDVKSSLKIQSPITDLHCKGAKRRKITEVNGDASKKPQANVNGDASKTVKVKPQANVNGDASKIVKVKPQANGHSAAAPIVQSSEDSSSNSDKETDTLTCEQKAGAFSNFRISPNTIKLLEAKGITYLFDIQVKTFNSVYDGKDVIGQARTGTGKTLAFAIPLIEKLQSVHEDRKRGRSPKVLALAPTRELAIQVAKDFKDVTKKLSITCFYGGSSYNPQIDAIRGGIDILVGTPGRIKDHLQNNKLDLSQLKHVILDEVDQMLDMGFAEQVEEILAASYQPDSSNNPQTLLFSATCPSWVYDVAKRYMRTEYEHVDLIGKKTQKTATTVEHLAIACHWSQRAAVIGDVISVYSGSHGRSIVFCETKRDATELSTNSSIKQNCQTLHGDIPQRQREITLKGFRAGTFEVLVATNVAARGLDIPEIDLVIQSSPPKDVESYIHRSGRTGRAGRTGVCICFYQRKEEEQLRNVEHKAGITFKRVGVPTSNDIIKSSSKDALKYLDSVPPTTVEYFRGAAEKLIEERGAVMALAAALAHISGATSLEQRSLLNSDAGYTTMVMSCSQEMHNIGFAWRGLKEQLGEEIDGEIQRMTFLKGKKGVCFDAPAAKVKEIQDAWQDGRRWQLSVAMELPELEESKHMGGERGSSGRSFRGRGRGNGFRNNGNWRGGGGQKRTFSNAFDY